MKNLITPTGYVHWLAKRGVKVSPQWIHKLIKRGGPVEYAICNAKTGRTTHLIDPVKFEKWRQERLKLNKQVCGAIRKNKG